MDYLTISTLANELDISVGELFSKFKDRGWIKRINDIWMLTHLEKQKGGQTSTNQKFGEFIVRPKNISLNLDQQTNNNKPKLLYATLLGKHFKISTNGSL
jgi:hypothetical protein